MKDCIDNKFIKPVFRILYLILVIVWAILYWVVFFPIAGVLAIPAMGIEWVFTGDNYNVSGIVDDIFEEWFFDGMNFLKKLIE